MSNISYYYNPNDEQNYAYICIGKDKTLKKLIETCCNKLDFNDSDVKWFIYDSNNEPTTLKDRLFPLIKLSKKLSPIKPVDYYEYYYNLSNNEIYISETFIDDPFIKSIVKENSLIVKNIFKDQFKAPNEKKSISTIEELIINAITRLQTKQIGNNEIFKRKFEENRNKYIS